MISEDVKYLAKNSVHQITRFFNGIIAFRSYKFKAIEALDFEKMKKIADSIDDLDFFSENKNDITTSILSDSYKLPFDSEGRISIPNELLKFANIKNQATFVARGSSFQIWNPIFFKKHLRAVSFGSKQWTVLNFVFNDLVHIPN